MIDAPVNEIRRDIRQGEFSGERQAELDGNELAIRRQRETALPGIQGQQTGQALRMLKVIEFIAAQANKGSGAIQPLFYTPIKNLYACRERGDGVDRDLASYLKESVSFEIK